MRELTYYIATSLDGFIAHGDGSHAGFSEDPAYLQALFSQFPETVPSHFRAALGIEAPNQHFDTVLMGRKTYEVGLKEGVTSPYSHLRQYVVSRSLSESPDAAVTLVSTDAIATVQALKVETGQGIWLCGGGTLATALLTAGLIDLLLIKINPFVMGSGIPLFAAPISTCRLQLSQQQRYPSGVMLMDYGVVSPGESELNS
jgi:dihydrofolate reductase